MDQFLNIIIATSVTALIILGVKGLLRSRISPKWHMLIWAVLAIRLLVPVLPKSNISVLNSVPQVRNIEISDEVMKKSMSETKTYTKSKIVIGERNREFILSKAVSDNIMTIWASGTAIMILYMSAIYLAYYIKSRKYKVIAEQDILSVLEECKSELNIRKDIVVRLGEGTPLLRGILKPQIIISDGYTKEELKSVFMHELMHLKHRDILWNITGTLLLCGYWYNPIIWYSFFVFRRDMEILCDYGVLQVYDDRKGYASVLLKTAIKKNKFIMGTTSMQNGEKDITRRIKYIAYFKRPRVIWSITAIVVIISVAGICLTNPSANFNIKAKTADGLNYDQIYKCRTQYVGDASKISSLTSNLYYSEYRNGISLKTASKPYEININYLMKQEQSTIKEVASVNDYMLRNASIIFCLVDNVDTIHFTFQHNAGSNGYQFKREFLENIFKCDIRKYSSSSKEFCEKFIPMLNEKDWSYTKKLINGTAAKISIEVEKNLKIIMSSPLQSSNPGDYKKAHQTEYENIVKMGDDALQYMLSLFEYGDTKSLKAHIMMSLCIDILGDRNNVKEGTYSSPEEWYAKFSPYKALKLPEFKYKAKNDIEKLVYTAAIEKYSNNNNESVTIVAPHIFGTYENGKQLKIFVTIYYKRYKLYGNTLSENGGGIVPAAVVYNKNDNGGYILKEYIEAKDGTEFNKSIKEFCKPRNDMAEAIIKHYGNYQDLFVTMKKNLIIYLDTNGMKDVNIKQSDGKAAPLIQEG